MMTGGQPRAAAAGDGRYHERMQARRVTGQARHQVGDRVNAPGYRRDRAFPHLAEQLCPGHAGRTKLSQGRATPAAQQHHMNVNRHVLYIAAPPLPLQPRDSFPVGPLPARATYTALCT
jgi:hypothetical protein